MRGWVPWGHVARCSPGDLGPQIRSHSEGRGKQRPTLLPHPQNGVTTPESAPFIVFKATKAPGAAAAPAACTLSCSADFSAPRPSSPRDALAFGELGSQAPWSRLTRCPEQPLPGTRGTHPQMGSAGNGAGPPGRQQGAGAQACIPPQTCTFHPAGPGSSA